MLLNRVGYSKLSNLLVNNIRQLIIRLLLNTYSQSTAVGSWNRVGSGAFVSKNGVIQYGIINPLLFSIDIDPLNIRLSNSGLGSHMANICFNILA